jgi:hypothetical protein
LSRCIEAAQFLKRNYWLRCVRSRSKKKPEVLAHHEAKKRSNHEYTVEYCRYQRKIKNSS